MKIDRAEARRIAGLARLAMDDGELDRMAVEMSKILTYIDQLKEVDIAADQVEAAAGPMREDVPQESTPREQAAANAPDWQDGFFAVPKVIGE